MGRALLYQSCSRGLKMVSKAIWVGFIIAAVVTASIFLRIVIFFFAGISSLIYFIPIIVGIGIIVIILRENIFYRGQE